jgi:hypothetical protein
MYGRSLDTSCLIRTARARQKHPIQVFAQTLADCAAFHRQMLREEAAAGTELCLKVRELLGRGELVDDETMIATIRK